MIKRWNHLVQLSVIVFLTFIHFILGTSNYSTHTWNIKIKYYDDNHSHKKHFDELANGIADELGVFNKGQIGELTGFYLFESDTNNHDHLLKLFDNHKHIEWHSKEVDLKRTKRSHINVPNLLHFNDPLYNEQWHLQNLIGYDCNVTGVWARNITGKGIVVAVVDDGVEWRHPDLKDNYCKEGSFDLNSNDDDPSPVYDEEEENKHGTRCAGEIAAVPNSVCGVGIAFGSKFSGIRVLDGTTTDSSEATAFNKHMDVNDIYSCSWGPEDDGKTVDGPHDLGRMALQHGVVAGRDGFGSIFVVASGNGGLKGDNCNYDGYASSIYTITIGAIDEMGNKPSYAEECASMLACSVSSGSGLLIRDIVTTDWSLPPGNSDDQCTHSHTGTSAATPLAAGMVALMLEARPCLTWRDIQHIMVMTAVEVDHATAWTQNKAGFRHSNIHGFGLLDAWRLVNAAKVWKSVPWFTSLTADTSHDKNLAISMDRHESLILHTEVTTENCKNNMLSTLEYILFTVTVTHHTRGNLKFILLCPSGTRSEVPTRRSDTSDKGLTDWSFSTVKCWGENPAGKYTLKVIDTSRKLPQGESLGVLKSWKLTLYGSSWTADEMKKRKTYIESVMDGSYLDNFSLPCPPGTPLEFDVTSALSDRTIKLVTMISCFLLFWGVYYTIEMAFCNAEDKEEKENDIENDQTDAERIETPQNGYGTSTESVQLFPNSTFIGTNEDVAMLDIEEDTQINNGDPGTQKEAELNAAMTISNTDSFLSAELEVNSQINDENIVIDNSIEDVT
uniref:proprotein convertase subtilisin/kexin type 7-like n=1 Tax=Styela clava TaxID=7725 RepID=UPI00193A65C8|nr:proprotein convertase subtilisin/kexin type 7-like [Styela clava]